jgi:hypothetical protein
MKDKRSEDKRVSKPKPNARGLYTEPDARTIHAQKVATRRKNEDRKEQAAEENHNEN